MSRRRVVFVSHNASRSGAPMLLLSLQRWLRDNADVDITTVLLDGGPLTRQFAAVGAVTGAGEISVQAPDLVYLNSVGSASVLPEIPDGVPVVCHVHEVAHALRHWIDDDDRHRLAERVERFVVVSDQAKEAVLHVLGVPSDRVLVHHGFIDVDGVRARAAAARPDASGDDTVLIGGSGTTEWRKAPDLFVALAVAVGDRLPAARFRWVGGSDSGPEIDPVLADRSRAGLDDVVEFVGEQDDAVPWLAPCTVFALTSRDDPFPLTCLEAAALGVPTVAFATTGAREFLEGGCGAVVPYPDLDAMADEVVALVRDHRRRAAVVHAATARVADHDVARAAPRLWADVDAVAAG